MLHACSYKHVTRLMHGFTACYKPKISYRDMSIFVHAAKGGAQPGTTGKKRKRNQPTAQISTQQGTSYI